MKPRGENIEYDKLRDRYDALAAECNACKEWSAARIGCDARITELEGIADARMERIEELEAALTLLTNGFKYSTEVVTIAREALAGADTEGKQL